MIPSGFEVLPPKEEGFYQKVDRTEASQKIRSALIVNLIYSLIELLRLQKFGKYHKSENLQNPKQNSPSPSHFLTNLFFIGQKNFKSAWNLIMIRFFHALSTTFQSSLDDELDYLTNIGNSISFL